MSALVMEKEAAAAASEDSNYSDDNGEDDGKRWKPWTEEDDTVLVAALRAGQSARSIRIGGRGKTAAYDRLYSAREKGLGTPVLREYLEETCPEYVYKLPQKRMNWQSWLADEDQTFIEAHREGKTFQEIAALLPGRTHKSVSSRWREAKIGKAGTAALRAYAAECCKG